MSNRPWFTPEYPTQTFAQVWDSYSKFKEDYDEIKLAFAINENPIDENHLKTTYYLLYCKYGNNPIINEDVNQFKFKIVSIIFQYAPKWAKQLEIQEKFKNMTEEELLIGSKQIYNHAYNPSTEPSTGALEELTYINDQSTTNNKRSKLDAYSILYSLLRDDLSKLYMDKFKSCFSAVAAPIGSVVFVDDNY